MQADREALGVALVEQMQKLLDQVYDSHERYNGKTYISSEEMEHVENECQKFRRDLFALSQSQITQDFLALAPDMCDLFKKNYLAILKAIADCEHTVGLMYNPRHEWRDLYADMVLCNPTLCAISEQENRQQGEIVAGVLRQNNAMLTYSSLHSVSGGYGRGKFW